MSGLVEQAARVTDPIAHSAPSTAFGLSVVGLIGGGLAALAAPITLGGSVVLVLGTAATGGNLARMAGEHFDNQRLKDQLARRDLPRVTDEEIAEGAETVFLDVERHAAAKAHPYTTASRHKADWVSTGSDTVFIENTYASRIGDTVQCGGYISYGSETVFYGGETAHFPGAEVDPSEKMDGGVYGSYVVALNVAELVAMGASARQLIRSGRYVKGARAHASPAPPTIPRGIPAAEVRKGRPGSPAAQRDAVRRRLAMDGPVDANTMHLIGQTPAYRTLYEQAVADGWTIVQKSGQGSYASEAHRLIVVDSSLPPTAKAYVLAHELGHYRAPPKVQGNTSLSRADFVGQNVDGMLLGEGQAQAAAQALREQMLKAPDGYLMNRGGADPLFTEALGARYAPGDDALRAAPELRHSTQGDLVTTGWNESSARYLAGRPHTGDFIASAYFERFRAGAVTAEDLTRRLGEDVFRRNMSTTGENYAEYWTKYYAETWDAANTP